MSESTFSDINEEKAFQEIFQIVNEITTCDKHLTENDSRLIFAAGIEFGKNTIREKFGICKLN